jgi:hypothetical protein
MCVGDQVYVKEIDCNRKTMLLLNKADLLSSAARYVNTVSHHSPHQESSFSSVQECFFCSLKYYLIFWMPVSLAHCFNSSFTFKFIFKFPLKTYPGLQFARTSQKHDFFESFKHFSCGTLE